MCLEVISDELRVAVLRDLITEAKKMTPEEYEMLLKESYDMEEVKIVFPKRATIWMTSREARLAAAGKLCVMARPVWNSAVKCPFKRVGTLLFLKETWMHGPLLGGSKYLYEADEPLEILTGMRQWMSPVCAPRDSVRRAAIVTTLKTISVGELVRQDLDALGTTREDIFHHYGVVSSHQTLWFVSLEDISIVRKQ